MTICYELQIGKLYTFQSMLFCIAFLENDYSSTSKVCWIYSVLIIRSTL